MAVYNSQLVTRLLNQINNIHPLANNPFEDAFELYHKIQEHDARHSTSSSNTIGLPALGHALAGSTGTALSHLILYPLDLVITRLQVQQQLKNPNEAPSAASLADDAEYTSLLDAATKIYNHEGGIQAFWNGCATDTAKSVIDSFLFFLAYTALRQRQQQRLGTKSLPVFAEISIGMTAGAISKLVTTPIQQIVTRKQTAAMVAARDTTSTVPPSMTPNLSIKDIFLQIRSERGISGFWAGYSASLILTLNPALTFLLQNLLKRILVPRAQRDKPGPKLTFLIAAVSKAAASTVTYPFSLAKSRAQVSKPMAEETQKSAPVVEKPDFETATQSSEEAKKTLKTLLSQNLAQLAIFRALSNIYKNEGFKGLYSGIEAEVVKGFLGHGLSMVLKERIHVLIISAYFWLLKVTKRWPENLGDVRGQASREIERVREAAGGVVGGAVEMGKDAGGKVVEAAGGVVGGAVEMGKDAGGKAIEMGKGVGGSAMEMGKGAGGMDVEAGKTVGERVQNVGETVVEGVKSAVGDKE